MIPEIHVLEQVCLISLFGSIVVHSFPTSLPRPGRKSHTLIHKYNTNTSPKRK